MCSAAIHAYCYDEGKAIFGVWDLGARLIVRVGQPLVAGLYVDHTVLLVESEGMFQRIADEFDKVCKRRMLKVNAGKSKVMVFERAREQTINFAKPHSRVRGYTWM